MVNNITDCTNTYHNILSSEININNYSHPQTIICLFSIFFFFIKKK